ncbi:MAG: hypothetical protein KBT50_08880 [Cycloclasticus sp.]|nr:hypothetical protein [Cycloclasticus sp.]MBQ0790718.1 hypothetical protein [Cycloclasticus sp.]
MQTNTFKASSFFIRFGVALVLVFASYNPSGFSYYHWIIKDISSFSPMMGLTGLTIIIAWAIYIRATLRSLGLIGISLALAFFASVFWLIIDWGLIATDNVTVLIYIVQTILCFILAIGLSWSHIRRRMSGQVDADDVDQ